MILREVNASRELGRMEMVGLRELIEANKIARNNELITLKDLFSQRSTAVEEGIKLAHENEARWPTTLDREIKGLENLIDQKLNVVAQHFVGVDQRFDERDQRLHDAQLSTKTAIDAAFKAASEAVKMQQDSTDRAVSKQEAAFSKQIESISALLGVAKAELDRQLNEVRTTLTTITATMAGRKEIVVEKNDNTGMLVGVGGFVLALIVAVISFVARGAG